MSDNHIPTEKELNQSYSKARFWTEISVNVLAVAGLAAVAAFIGGVAVPIILTTTLFTAIFGNFIKSMIFDDNYFRKHQGARDYKASIFESYSGLSQADYVVKSLRQQNNCADNNDAATKLGILHGLSTNIYALLAYHLPVQCAKLGLHAMQAIGKTAMILPRILATPMTKEAEAKQAQKRAADIEAKKAAKEAPVVLNTPDPIFVVLPGTRPVAVNVKMPAVENAAAPVATPALKAAPEPNRGAPVTARAAKPREFGA